MDKSTDYVVAIKDPCHYQTAKAILGKRSAIEYWNNLTYQTKLPWWQCIGDFLKK